MEDKEALSAYRSAIQARYLGGRCPHGSNMLHQVSDGKKRPDKVLAALDVIVPAYLRFVDSIEALQINLEDLKAEDATVILEDYLRVLRCSETSCFDSVTDFLTCVAPEFFLRIFDKMIALLELDLEASGQRDIPIELVFDPATPNLLAPRLQRVDIAVVKRMPLTVGEHKFSDFMVPVLVVESKTYFDKNMISGVSYSYGAIKSTFPSCACLAVSEWSDFDLDAQSFASSSIDEIFILRKQRRADFRKSGKLNQLAADTIEQILRTAWSVLVQYKVHRPTVGARLAKGRLIG